MIPRIPEELPIAENQSKIQELERWASNYACYLSPIIAIIAWAGSVKFLHYLLFLRPVTEQMTFSEGLTWKPALLMGIFSATVPWVWRISLGPKNYLQNSTQRLRLSPITATLFVAFAPLTLFHPSVRWTFCEWAIIRTPNPSFARNTLFWEERKFEIAQGKSHSPKICLIGSSQMYAATNATLIASRSGFNIEKNCLAGMGPIQYRFLENRILERSPNVVVLWLSEFDFFREDEIPTNRLRWSADFISTARLWKTLNENHVLFDFDDRFAPILTLENWSQDTTDCWRHRGEFADLILASLSPAWRNREHFQQIAFNYWWNHSLGNSTEKSNAQGESSELAQGINDIDVARDAIQRNIGDKRLVKTNFAAFRGFCNSLSQKGIRIITVEGTSQPALMQSYPKAYRLETRQSLQALNSQATIRFVDETQTPSFSNNDYADPYHLNTKARDIFSDFLANLLINTYR